MLQADLHIHTTASDGVFTPSKVVLRAKEKGISLLAVTDHDTVAGLEEAKSCALANGMQFLPGVELSAGGKAEVHVLGYGVKDDNERLNAFLADMRNERMERAAQMLEKLRALHMPLEMSDIPRDENNALGRPLIARAMIAKGYVQSVQQAFDQYLGSGRPAYVPRRKIEVSEAVSLLSDIGAVPVLAHPSLIRMEAAELKTAVCEWLDAGLRGIEIYHPAMTHESRMTWLSFAHRHQLLVTGGSDFHAIGDKHADIGEMVAGWKNCSEDAEKLLDAKEGFSIKAFFAADGDCSRADWRGCVWRKLLSKRA